MAAKKSAGTDSDAEIKALVRKFALKNAQDFGKAIEGAVLGKVLAANPSLRSNTANLAGLVKEQVGEVNKLDKAALENEIAKYSDEFKAAEAKKAEKSSKHSFEISGATAGNFVTRFPPEPGGYLHIGHIKAIFIEDVLRQRYNGKLMLYFDDTNPDLEKQEFVDAIHEDLKWLGIKFDGEYYASDHIPILYAHAKNAIGKVKAYVCTCDLEKTKELRFSGTGCEHKSQSIEKNMELWQMMLDGKFGSGKAVLRLNSDMKALNTTMRDPTLFRVKHAKHYRQGNKYSVWPTYDFCTPIIDSTKGITDVLRDKNYEMRDELYFAVLDLLGLRKPRITSFARLEISNNVTSKRKVRALIEEKRITGWDDPRLVTIMALRKRGVTLEAMREFALSSGMGKAESIVPIEALLRVNRRVVDPIAKRLFFIEHPIELKITGISNEDSEVSLRLHPTEKLGYRKYSTKDGVCITSEDAAKLKKGDTIRLKEAYDIKIGEITPKTITATYEGKRRADAAVPRLRWISKAGMIKCELWDIGELLVGDAFNEDSIKKRPGYVEGYANELCADDIVQFEGYGLYKFDGKKSMHFFSL